MSEAMMQAVLLMDGDVMTLQMKHTDATKDSGRLALLTVRWTLGALLSRFGWSPYPRLDRDGMGAHMQRDLGFLDGREPRYERAETR